MFFQSFFHSFPCERATMMGDIDILPTTFAEIQVKLHELVKTASNLAWFTYNFRDSMLQFQESADGRISNLERKIENLERQLNEIKEAAANPLKLWDN